MADCWVKLGFAMTAIVLVTFTFYQLGSRSAVAIEPPAVASAR